MSKCECPRCIVTGRFVHPLKLPFDDKRRIEYEEANGIAAPRIVCSCGAEKVRIGEWSWVCLKCDVKLPEVKG